MTTLGIGIGIGTGLLVVSKSKLVVSDTFNRADNNTSLGTADTGQAWQALSGVFGIVGNTAQLITAAGTTNTAVVDSGISNCVIKATLATNSVITRIAFRVTDATNMIFVQSNQGSSNYQILRVVDNAQTSIATVSRAPAAGDEITVNLDGSSIVVLINGTQAMSVTEAFNLTATKHGIGVRNTPSSSIDNFRVEAL
ncbi:hypothetical protein ACFQ3J_00405 [Paenibacillus provencensis]|uniref:Uncharacterized protein n=1 Tax=Paenibacillus provencensis TaxID=441151 RepID=A0ABW3PQI4_9BACL|nr:hypothetical protein [Paenibacillus sp. MER 78]MCM3130945.1 hypothetical protein [Paenibacillus sp. MER 78]